MPREEECKCEGGLPGWLATFADLMSLLLTFFVLLLSFSNQDVQKFKDMLGSIKEAFGVQIQRKEADYTAFSPTKFERKDIKIDQSVKQILGMVLQLKAMLEQNSNLKKYVHVSSDDNGILVRVSSGVMFDPGDAKIKPQAYPILDKVIKILKENNFDLVVRGHTDDRPVHSKKFPSNWELSAARAAAAARYIIEKGGINPARVKAVGYADTRPLVPNTSEANRALNRRVEFYFKRPEVESW
ncbi:MAG: OmpA family protein [Desulfonauticus sp.]|nr:OmpA family protein [Desulfonauticus sp.]